MKRPIVSVHLPKSGGTSVRRSFEDQFGPRALFDYGRGPLGPQARALEGGLPAGIDLVHGHFRPERYDSVDPAFRLTFLREPVDLLLSFYFFWRTMPYSGQALHRRFLDEAPPIETFAAWEPIRRLTSETFFGGYDMDRFDFIGFHETRDADLTRLNHLADLNIDISRRDNVTEQGREERQALASDTATMSRLADILSDDIRFYETIRERRG